MKVSEVFAMGGGCGYGGYGDDHGYHYGEYDGYQYGGYYEHSGRYAYGYYSGYNGTEYTKPGHDRYLGRL